MCTHALIRIVPEEGQNDVLSQIYLLNHILECLFSYHQYLFHLQGRNDSKDASCITSVKKVGVSSWEMGVRLYATNRNKRTKTELMEAKYETFLSKSDPSLK